MIRAGLGVSNRWWRTPRLPHVRGCEVSAWRGCWEASAFWRPRCPATGPTKVKTLHREGWSGGGTRWAGGGAGQVRALRASLDSPGLSGFDGGSLKTRASQLGPPGSARQTCRRRSRCGTSNFSLSAGFGEARKERPRLAVPGRLSLSSLGSFLCKPRVLESSSRTLGTTSGLALLEPG